MEGGGLAAGELGHAFGGAAGGSGEQGLYAHGVVHAEYAAQGGGLASAGTAGQGHDTASGGEAQGGPLQGGVDDAAFGLHALHKPPYPLALRFGFGGHGAQPLRDEGLGLIELCEVAGVPPGERAPGDDAALCQLGDRGGDQLRLRADELRGGRHELVRGDEAVAVPCVVPKLEDHGSADPVRVVHAAAEIYSQAVRGSSQVRERKRSASAKLPPICGAASMYGSPPRTSMAFSP